MSAFRDGKRTYESAKSCGGKRGCDPIFQQPYSWLKDDVLLKRRWGSVGYQDESNVINGEERKYHVKSHSSGTIFAKLISAYELLVYKVLELLGVGCETHLYA